jgi:hypothetical protein
MSVVARARASRLGTVASSGTSAPKIRRVYAPAPQAASLQSSTIPPASECTREDSNLHTSRYRNLNPARLPVPPLVQSSGEPARRRGAIAHGAGSVHLRKRATGW